MARSYGKIKVEVWDPGSDYRLLSLEAQWAYQMLISQESVSMAGTMPYAPRKWAKLAAGLSGERLEEIIAELERDAYVIVDRETEELLVRSFVKHNEPWRTPNFLTAARSKYRSTESAAIRDCLRDRHPWLSEPTDEREFHEVKDEIETYEARASGRVFERTSPLPFEQASPQASVQALPQHARTEIELEPETEPEEFRVKGSSSTPRATAALEEPPLRARASEQEKERLPVRAVCPECGPLHDVGVDFDLEEHRRNVHGVEPEPELGEPVEHEEAKA